MILFYIKKFETKQKIVKDVAENELVVLLVPL